MRASLLTPRMVAKAVQAALHAGALHEYLSHERIWRELQRRWDPAWDVRDPCAERRFMRIGYTMNTKGLL